MTRLAAPAAPDLVPVFSAEDVSLLPEMSDIQHDEGAPLPEVRAHFMASAALYKRWSPEGHLHFGHWQRGISLLDRRAMLEAMVRQVANALGLRRGERVGDLGCGYGAAARLIAKEREIRAVAISVVQEQVDEGRTINSSEAMAGQVCMLQGDFRHTPLGDGSLDAAYFLESICYAEGAAKADALSEAARILKPGGRIAVADGYLLKEAKGLRGLMVRTVEKGWALPCFPQRLDFIEALESNGFTDVRVQDLSWNVAPCAVHGPLLMVRCWLDRLRGGTKLDALERAHLRSCLLGILLGTQRDLFRYLLISATKA